MFLHLNVTDALKWRYEASPMGHVRGGGINTIHGEFMGHSIVLPYPSGHADAPRERPIRRPRCAHRRATRARAVRRGGERARESTRAHFRRRARDIWRSRRVVER